MNVVVTVNILEPDHCILRSAHHHRLYCPSITRLGNNASKMLGLQFLQLIFLP